MGVLVRHCICPPYARLREAEAAKELNKCRREGVQECRSEGGDGRWRVRVKEVKQ